MKTDNINLDSDQIDLSKHIRALQFNFFRIIFIFVSFLVLWFFYFTQSPKIYQVNSLIQVKQNDNRPTVDIEKILFSSGEDINLEEQISLYMSHTNKEKIINDLDLRIVIDNDGMQLKDQKSLNINLFQYKLEPNKLREIFFLNPSEDGYTLTNQSNENFTLKGYWSKDSVLNESVFNISKPENINKEYKITFYSVDEAIKKAVDRKLNIRKLLTNRYLLTQGTLLEISYRSENTKFAKELINKANDVFFNQSIKFSVQEAKLSLDYIEQQLSQIENELKANQDLFNSFQNKNISVDIELEVLAIVDQLSLLREQIAANEVELVQARSVYQSGNPLLEKISRQSDELKRQEEQLELKIKELPDLQKEYVNLRRNLDISQSLYESLLVSKMEYALMEASTIGNVRVIDEAYVEEKISPNGLVSLLLTLFFATVVSVFYALIRQFYFSPVRLPSDMTSEFPHLQVLGLLNHYDDTLDLSESEQEDVNSLATNILLSLEEKDNGIAPIVLITGATPKVGKSFTSMQIAKTFSNRDKKTLLIDLDYKRGDINKEFNVRKLEPNEILSDQFSYDDFRINENLVVIPRARNQSKDALRIFESPEFKRQLEQFKKDFDIIVFDTPPILSLSDSMYLAKYADLLIPVIRHNYSMMRDIKQMLNDFSVINKDINYYIYNAFEKPSGYYGYDYYAYKYYSNYKYYSYESKDD